MLRPGSAPRRKRSPDTVGGRVSVEVTRRPAEDRGRCASADAAEARTVAQRLDARTDEPPDRRLVRDGVGGPAGLRALFPPPLASFLRRHRWAATGRRIAGQAG